MDCCLLSCLCCCKGWLFVLAIFVGLKIYLKYRVKFCTSSKRMDGKTVLITGGNAGIGFETAKELARRRARVILACRDMKKAEQARDDIIRLTGNTDVVVRKVDLSSLSSVRDFAKEIVATESRIDVLINNAGLVERGKAKTGDGLLKTMQVNHFAPFLLTNLLVDLMKKSAPSRIIFVSSVTHHISRFDVDNLNYTKPQFYHSDFHVYASSKMANILTANELSRRLAKSGVTVNSLHPGTIYTGIWNSMPFGLRQVAECVLKNLFKTPLEGAQTTIHLAVSDEVEGVTGKYFHACKEAKPSALANDQDLAKKLWKLSEAAVKQNQK